MAEQKTLAWTEAGKICPACLQCYCIYTVLAGYISCSDVTKWELPQATVHAFVPHMLTVNQEHIPPATLNSSGSRWHGNTWCDQRSEWGKEAKPVQIKDMLRHRLSKSLIYWMSHWYWAKSELSWDWELLSLSNWFIVRLLLLESQQVKSLLLYLGQLSVCFLSCRFRWAGLSTWADWEHLGPVLPVTIKLATTRPSTCTNH